MKSLDILNKELYLLLEKNHYILRLIRKELISECLEDINLLESEKLELKEKLFKEYKVKNDKEFKEILEKSNIDLDYFMEDQFFHKRKQKFIMDKFGNRIEAHFLKRKNDLDEVIYSLIRVGNPYKANEIYQRIIEDEANFGDLAKEFSLGPEKFSRGIVGPLPISNSHPIVADQIRSHKTDQIIKPFQVDSVWIIIRIELLNEANLTEEVELIMANELFNAWISEKIVHHNLKLRTKLDIEPI